MKLMKLVAIFILTLAISLAQTGSALAQEPVTNKVTVLACGTDGTTILVTYDDGDATTPEVMVEVSLEDAVTLGLIASGVECSTETLANGVGTTIDPAALTPVEAEPQHPVGAALSLFFSGITDYETIMTAHEGGIGFGVIAQALWLTQNLEGDTATFNAIIEAKQSGDFSAFILDDGSTPQNWGQFRKAVLDNDKKDNLGVVKSDKSEDNVEKTNNGKGPKNSEETNKQDKNDKGNKGNGNQP